MPEKSKLDTVSVTYPERITITTDGAEREIFMSFGLLNHLTTIVGDPARVASIPLNPELRREVLESVLAKRKPSGKLEEKIDLDDVDISIADVETLLDWVSGHVMSFFIRSLQKVAAVTQAHQTELASLVSFLDGSKGSASEKPSSGA